MMKSFIVLGKAYVWSRIFSMSQDRCSPLHHFPLLCLLNFVKEGHLDFPYLCLFSRMKLGSETYSTLHSPTYPFSWFPHSNNASLFLFLHSNKGRFLWVSLCLYTHTYTHTLSDSLHFPRKSFKVQFSMSSLVSTPQ